MLLFSTLLDTHGMVAPALIALILAQAAAPTAASKPVEPEPSEIKPAEMTPPGLLPQAPRPYTPERPVVRPFEMPDGQVPAVAPPPVDPKAPVTVEQYDRSYEPPADPVDQAYQQGVRQAFDRGQALMGPLDGEWTVAREKGAPLLALVINEPGEAAPLEGAWRRLDQADSGLIDVMERQGDVLTCRFVDSRGQQEALTLTRTEDGRWRGRWTANGVSLAVVMVRP